MYVLTSLKNNIHNRATTLLDFSKGHYNGLCYFLINSSFYPCFHSDNIESVWSYISRLIKDAINQFAPTIMVYHNNQPKWFNSSIRHHVNCVWTLHCKYNRHPTNHNKLKLENSETLLKAKISNAKVNYESSLISCSFNCDSRIYKHTKLNYVIQTQFHLLCTITLPLLTLI